VSANELAAHAARLARIAERAGRCVWRELDAADEAAPALAMAG
jgi:hypothetical protein